MQEMQETQVQSLGWEDLLKKEMASYSSILAWEVPWIEEPGGLQSMGAYQALPSLGFSRQEYWSGVSLPSPAMVVRSSQWLLQ